MREVDNGDFNVMLCRHVLGRMVDTIDAVDAVQYSHVLYTVT